MNVSTLSEFYDNMQSRIDQLEKQIATKWANNSQYLKTVEDKLERLERSSRSACLEIRNIPVQKPETK